MTTNWQSSPIRQSPGLEDVQMNQRVRANNMRHPMSSPIRNGSNQAAKDRIKQELKSLRTSVREAKSELKRERKLHEEDAQMQIDKMEAQAAALAIDLDLLIEEEIATMPHPDFDEANDAYDEELEDYLAQEELELEAQLKELSIL